MHCHRFDLLIRYFEEYLLLVEKIDYHVTKILPKLGNDVLHMLNKKNIFILSIIFFLSLFVFFASSIVDARAGGGHSFRSSSSSSRSSSRSYSSSHSYSSSRSYSSSSRYSSSNASPEDTFFSFLFAILFISHFISFILLYMMLFHKTMDEVNTGIVLIICLPTLYFFYITGALCPFIAFYYFMFYKRKSDTTEKRNYSFNEINNLTSITSKDPLFNKNEFLVRAKKAFIIVQRAWSARDLSRAEAFLADGTYEKFQIQINTMKTNHEIDLMEDIEIKKASIIRLDSKSGYDSIYVLFTVSAVNYRIDDRTKKIKDGSTLPEEFSEVWTFMRRTGSKSIKNGLIEGYCPNCGAKVEGARLSKCPSCSSLLRSGQHDWILAGITQASEWRNTNSRIPTAYNAMLHIDKSINIPHLEDKLSVIFWRMVEANRLGNSEPILKISTNEFAEAFNNSKFIKSFPKTNDTAIGSAEVMAFVTNRPDYDYSIGQIVWSGAFPNSKNYLTYKTMFVLRRKKGVLSDPEKCFCSSHCPNCGAAESDNISSNTCEYCNTAMNDDGKDWMLSDIQENFNTIEARKYREDARQSSIESNQSSVPKEDRKQSSKTINIQSSTNKVEAKQSPTKLIGLDSNQSSTNQNLEGCYELDYNNFDYFSGKELLSITIAMMLADDIIDNREMDIINNICKARNISDKELNQIIDKLQTMPDPVQYVLDTTSIKLDINLLKLLINIAAADNKIEISEYALLRRVATKMNIPEKLLKDLINKTYESNWNR